MIVRMFMVMRMSVSMTVFVPVDMRVHIRCFFVSVDFDRDMRSWIPHFEEDSL